MTKEEALKLYWAAKNHDEEHIAMQWLIIHGLDDTPQCQTCIAEGKIPRMVVADSDMREWIESRR
jgi:hypothetical protein